MAARQPTVQWNETKQRWMAWVRFPDGSRRKVERTEQVDAEADLKQVLAERAGAVASAPRRERLASFDDVMNAWVEAGAPRPPTAKKRRHAKKKSENTLITIGYLFDGHVRPKIGSLKVDRTGIARLEEVFGDMAEGGYATSTIDHAWSYLHQACQYGLRQRLIKTCLVADVLLPEAQPAKERKSFTVEQFEAMLLVAIPADPRPALWITGLTCGLRPGELAGLRWKFVDIDSDDPHVEVAERAKEVRKHYVGQADPKTSRKGAIGLHPLAVAALRRHRAEMHMLGLYDPEGFVFCTRNRTALSISNLRRDFRRLCSKAGIEGDWTTYELRHSFVSLVADRIDDLAKVADMAGHSNTRTTEGYRHAVRATLPHAVTAWDELLDRRAKQEQEKAKAERQQRKALQKAS
jgi:integrase